MSVEKVVTLIVGGGQSGLPRTAAGACPLLPVPVVDPPCPEGQTRAPNGACYDPGKPVTNCRPGFTTTRDGRPCPPVDCKPGQVKYASGVCGPVVVERQQCPNGFYRRYSDSDCERVVVYRECQPGMRKTERGDCVCARPFERVVNGRCETYVVDCFPTCTRPLVYRFSSRSCVYPNIPDPVYPLTDGGNLVDVRPEPEYCGGRTSDGCDMRLEVVPRDGNRAERVCVMYCPRQNPGEPPVETAISTTWTEPTTQGERPIETGISAPAIEPGPKGEPPMPTPVSASTSEPAPAGIRPAQMPASAPFWAEPNSPTKRP